VFENHEGKMVATDSGIHQSTPQQNAARRQWSWFTAGLILALIAVAVWIAKSTDAANPAATSLQYQWVFVAAILTAFCALSGYLINGRFDGILIDDRNRVSLSRLQWVTWFIVLLGGYFTEAVWNMAHGQAYPLMQQDLFILLGIVSGSAVTSNVIVDSKKAANGQSATGQSTNSQPPSQPQPGQPDQIGSIDRNATIGEASWADLFMGEEVANRDVVDISRLQKLVITILLVITYVKLLWDGLEKVGVIQPDPSLSDAAKKAFSASFNMPSVNNTFLWLLGISHAAYLAYKATPKTAPATTATQSSAQTQAPQVPSSPAPTAGDDAFDGCEVGVGANATSDEQLPGVA
jgi:hypothetical protein